MKKNIFSICSLLSVVAFAVLLAGCADWSEKSSYQIEKPASVAEAERLSSYETLLAYVTGEDFHLGNTLTAAQVDEAGPAFSATLSNFNEVFISNLFVHKDMVDNEGNINTLIPATMVQNLAEKYPELNIFGSPLCASTNLNLNYLQSLIASVEVTDKDPQEGDEINGFDNYEVGTTFPMKKTSGASGAGKAVVEEITDGHGHVVHVTKNNQSYPAITFEFKDNRTLGTYRELHIDYKANNATALNQQLFFSLAGKNVTLKSAKDFGLKLKEWGTIVIDLDAMSFDEDQNKLTEAELIFGPKLMNCDYMLDNVNFHYKYYPTHIVEKTEAQKFEIIYGALNEYIDATMEAAPTIDTWIVADSPVTSPDNLIWKATLGGNRYFGYAAKMMRENDADAKLFVSEKNLEDATVRADFLTALKQAELSQPLDGIDVVVSVNAVTFDAATFRSMLGDLADTGKLIHLTIQSVSGTDAQAADALKQIVTIYREKVTGAQRYGLSFGSVTESATNAGLWTSGYNRKSTYASFADVLGGFK